MKRGHVEAALLSADPDAGGWTGTGLSAKAALRCGGQATFPQLRSERGESLSALVRPVQFARDDVDELAEVDDVRGVVVEVGRIRRLRWLRQWG